MESQLLHIALGVIKGVCVDWFIVCIKANLHFAETALHNIAGCGRCIADGGRAALGNCIGTIG